jgi:hypothetical protein
MGGSNERVIKILRRKNMIGVTFNHDINDDPYRQSDVKKGLDRLDAVCDKLKETLFISWSNRDRNGFFGPNFEDDYVVIHYDHALTKEQKEEIADCIRQTLTVKKTVYKKDAPSICIVFSKISEEDCFCYHLPE